MYRWCFISYKYKGNLIWNHIDAELSFDKHVSPICGKATKKLHALGCIASFMSFEKRRTFVKTFSKP